MAMSRLSPKWQALTSEKEILNVCPLALPGLMDSLVALHLKAVACLHMTIIERVVSDTYCASLNRGKVHAG